MTPDESVNQIIPLADAAGAVIGEGWHIESPEYLTPTEHGIKLTPTCTLPNGTDGGNYGPIWRGPGVVDPPKSASEISAAWQKLGTKVTPQDISYLPGEAKTTRVLANRPYLSGTDPDGYSIVLYISTEQTYFDVSTHCIPIPKDQDEDSTSSDIQSGGVSESGDGNSLSDSKGSVFDAIAADDYRVTINKVIESKQIENFNKIAAQLEAALKDGDTQVHVAEFSYNVDKRRDEYKAKKQAWEQASVEVREIVAALRQSLAESQQFERKQADAAFDSQN